MTQSTPSQQAPSGTGKHVKRWIPDQPGAWFMALAPALAGVFIGGPSWRNLWLLAVWTLCYCFQFSTARFLAVLSHLLRKRTKTTKPIKASTLSEASRTRLHLYLVPAATYALGVAITGIPLLATIPSLLVWLPILMLLAVLSFVTAYTRTERTLLGNAVSVLCAGLLGGISVTLGAHYFSSIPAQAQSIPQTAVVTALLFITTEYASVLFVKTMIRERGHAKYYALSVVYHIALVPLAFAGHTAWGIAALVLLARAAVLPKIGARLKPVHVGLVEIATSLMNFLVAVLTL